MTQLTMVTALRKTAYALKRYPLYRTLNLLHESQYWQPGELLNFRNEKVARLIAHAYDCSPYYRDRMDSLRLKPKDVRTVDALHKLPILTRRDVRLFGPQIICTGGTQGAPIVGRTSGSTGEPVEAWNDLRGIAWGNAAYFRGLSWAGYDFDRHRLAELFGGQLRNDEIEVKKGRSSWSKTLTLSAFSLRRETAPAYFDLLGRFAPDYLKGYAGATYLLARAKATAGAPALPLKAIFTTSEYLPPSQRTWIESAFNAPVFDYYGCVEISSLGYECPEHAGYHIPQEHVVFESIREDGEPEIDDGAGAFLVTDLDNYCMPLIRYRNGDTGELSDEPCACGRTLRRIKKLYGRVTDLLRGSDGNWIDGGVVDYIVSHSDHIVQFRLIQENANCCVFQYVSEGSDDDAVAIAADMKTFLGSDMRIELDRREVITPSPSGKRRLTICRLQDQDTESGMEPDWAVSGRKAPYKV